MTSLIRHEITIRRRTIIGWVLGLGFFALMYMAFYPALPEEMRNLDMGSIDIYKSMGVESMATFDGYMRSSVYNFLPLLVGVLGIVLGAGALAGDEDSGTLELLASLPISRLGLYVAKAAAALLVSFVVVGIVALAETAGFLAIESQIDTLVQAPDVFWIVLAHWLIAFVFIALALALGAFMPSRGSALSASSALLVLTFFGNNLAGLVTKLESVKPALPFSHFADFVRAMPTEVLWGDLGVLAAMGIVLLLLGAVGFQRRNLTVGAWPWQRPRPAAPVAAIPSTAASQPAAPARPATPARPTTPAGAMAERPATSRTAAERPAAAAPRGNRGAWPWRLGLLMLAAFACVAAVSLALSEDLRSDVRERLGLDESSALQGSAVVEDSVIDALSPASGLVVSVPVSIGDGVDGGAVIAVLADERDPVRAAAQLVLESGWQLMDELAIGRTDVGILDLRGAVEEATASQAAAEAAVQGAREEAGRAGELPQLEDAAALATARAVIARARLDLAERGVSATDLAAVDEAMARAQEGLGGGADRAVLTTVAAPESGTILDLLVGPGEVVSAGQRLAIISRGGWRELVVSLGDDEASRLDEGDEVEVSVGDDGDPISGWVVEIQIADDTGGDDEAPRRVRIGLRDVPPGLVVGDDVDVEVRPK